MVPSLIDKFLKKVWLTAHALFWLGGWLFVLGLLIWYGMRWWSEDRFWPVRLVNYMMPWLLLGLVPGLVVSSLARRRSLALMLALPTILIGLTFAPLFLPRPSPVLAGTATLKVMSYNVWWHNKNEQAAFQLIEQVQPDILLLQEVDQEMVHKLGSQLTGLYPQDRISFAYEPSVGQAIVSRFPIVSTCAERPKGRTQKAIVETPHGPIAVWNVHISQPIKWPRQYWQISALMEDVAAVDLPLIVGGDFNTTDQSEAYQLINRYLDNAHWEAGWGFGFSFPAHTPRIKGLPVPVSLVRIDHIFYNDHFFVPHAGTLPQGGGSDHRPVVAEFVLIK